MTSPIKRRLAMLGLALALIAAAPYGFHAIADRHIAVRLGNRAPWVVGLEGAMMDDSKVREVHLWAGYVLVGFQTLGAKSRFACVPIYSWTMPERYIDVPHESITLRLASAVALTGVWLLVFGGRWLAKRWKRTDTN